MSTTEQPSRLGRGLSRLAAPLLIAVAIQSIANLAFHAVVGRTLQAAEYGALGAVLAGMTLVAVPLSALQTAAARTSAKHGVTRATAGRALSRTLMVTLPLAALLVVAAGPIRDFLHLGSWLDAAVLAPTLVAAALVAIGRGLLLGIGRTGLVAGSFLVATAVRLGPGLLCAYLWGISGALIGTLIGEVAGLLVVVIPLLRAETGPLAVVTLGDLLRTAVVVAGLFAFSTVDLFLARHYLVGTESGFYVAAATIGKTVLALPAAALSVAYPKLVAGWLTDKKWAVLRSSLLVVGLPAVAGVAVVAIAPSLVLGILYGDSYSGAAGVTRILAIIAGLSAFVSVLAHAALARGSRWALIPWAAAGLEIVLIGLRHSTMTEVAQGSGIALIVALLALLATELPKWLGHRSAAASPASAAGGIAAMAVPHPAG